MGLHETETYRISINSLLSRIRDFGTVHVGRRWVDLRRAARLPAREKEEKAQAASEMAQRETNACINLPSLPIQLLEKIANAHSVHPDSIRITESPHLTAIGNCEVSVYLPVGACRYIIEFNDDFVPKAYGLSYHGRNINCGL